MMDLQQRIGEFQQIAQQDIEKKQNELLQPILQKANEAVKKVASAGGYTAVFDTSLNALAYYDEAAITDIEPAVRAELGIAATTATPAANSSGIAHTLIAGIRKCRATELSRSNPRLTTSRSIDLDRLFVF